MEFFKKNKSRIVDMEKIKKLLPENIYNAYQYSSKHKNELEKDNICGCFYCLEMYDPKEIQNWLNEDSGTALCPHCGIDSVIGESSGFSITKEFLKEMNKYWFGEK